MKRLGIVALIVLLVSGLMFQAAATPNAYARPRALLSDSLVAYWSMDETSGSRADVVGSNDLSDNNTVGSTSGKISNAAALVSANSEWLSLPDNADMSLANESISFAGWLYPQNVSGFQVVFSRDNCDSPCNARDYLVYISSNKINAFVFNGSTSQICGVSQSITQNAWQFYVFTFDSATDACSSSINDGTVSTNNESSPGGNTSNSAITFGIGARPDGSGYFDGYIDEFGFWKKKLTSGEITTLFNSNAGCTHPFTSCEATPTPTATSTATNTPTATPTFTPTPSATPKWWSETTLTNGGTFVVERRATLGEGFIAMFGAAVLGVFLLKWLLDFIGKHIK